LPIKESHYIFFSALEVGFLGAPTVGTGHRRHRCHDGGQVEQARSVCSKWQFHAASFHTLNGMKSGTREGGGVGSGGFW